MTDHTDEVFDDTIERQAMDDLELITRMLNHQLDPERVEAVKERLKTDTAFRDLAAPLLLAWTVPPRRERVPRPEGELEREWEKFKQRPRIKQLLEEPVATVTTKRTPRWPYWIAGLVLAIAGVVAITVVTKRNAAVAPEVAAPLSTDATSDRVPYSPDWITLSNGIEVKLTPDAELRVAHQRLRGMRHLLLTGIAQFRIPELDTAGTPGRTQSLVLQTPVGYLMASESEFSVIAGADTTFVHVHALPGNGPIPPTSLLLTPVLDIADREQFLVISTPSDARLVRGRNPVLLRTPTTPH